MSAQARRKKCDQIWKWARGNWLSHGKPWDLASILPSTVMRCPQPPKQRSTNQTEASSTEAQKPTQPTSNHKSYTCQSVCSYLQLKYFKLWGIRIERIWKFLFPEEMWAHWVRSHDTCWPRKDDVRGRGRHGMVVPWHQQPCQTQLVPTTTRHSKLLSSVRTGDNCRCICAISILGASLPPHSILPILNGSFTRVYTSDLVVIRPGTMV